MVEINLPYDKKMITARIPDKNFIGLLESKAEHFSNPYTEKETVEKSLDNPIGSLPLEELAKGKKDIVLISSDHTRPVPSHIITPIILRRIRSVNKTARIRILVATGFHRPSTREELISKYGKEIVENEEIVMHISTDDSSMVKIGQLPSGAIVSLIALQQKQIYCWPKDLLNHTFLQDFLVDVNLFYLELLLIKPSWLTILENLLIPPTHGQEI